MKIITYNLRFGGTGKGHWAKILDEHDPDIFLVQESYAPDEHLPPMLHGDLWRCAVWNAVPGQRWGSAVYVKGCRPERVSLGVYPGNVAAAVIAPYFQTGVIASGSLRLPLLADHHGDLLAKFDLATRAIAGQVFRRTLMAEEFLLRYLADVERNNAEKWADYLAERYVKPLDGHLETLEERVHAYLETLVSQLGTTRRCWRDTTLLLRTATSSNS